MKKIVLTFPDGNKREFEAGITAGEVAQTISMSLSKKAISADLDGSHWDLQWPILRDSEISINTLKDKNRAIELVRHDLAHIMARAVQEIWPEVKVTIGPVINYGWYYDFDREEPFTPEDLGKIEKKMREIINLRDPVRTELWDRNKAINYYEKLNEPYKIELIGVIPQNDDIRMYWHGNWQDLCRGPHFQNTAQVPADAFKLMSVAGAYWRGDSNRQMLQRIYGVAFLNKENLREHLNMLEEAAKRDHRKIGKEMDLFHMQEEAPGQIFWHPNGWKIYTLLQDYMRRQQEVGGYVEVNTPQVVDRKLWEASGHWDKYQEHMFIVEVDEEHAREKAINALKPMNCPCHIVLFNSQLITYKDLPLRYSEFGKCHRYEPSGALNGLFRVRGFTQDDAHIFCTAEQIYDVCNETTQLIERVYKKFGFEKIKYNISTRPEKSIGSQENWDNAESQLKKVLSDNGKDFNILDGEGAFYGPKIEFTLEDSLGREWQCGTIQIDFNLPERLGAKYKDKDDKNQVPIMIHRAVVGSLERFIAIILENTNGWLPLFITPVQLAILPVSEKFVEHCQKINEELRDLGVRSLIDDSDNKLGYKIRSSVSKKIPYSLVVGEKEIESSSFTLRSKKGDNQSFNSVKELTEFFNN